MYIAVRYTPRMTASMELSTRYIPVTAYTMVKIDSRPTSATVECNLLAVAKVAKQKQSVPLVSSEAIDHL